MPPKLTVQNAEIQTASVEIKTLTVSGKQVTLAVFRQLQSKPLFDDEGSLVGEPWGTVNYHPEPKSCPAFDHWHVVWQDNNELRRSVMPVDITPHLHPVFPFRPKEGSMWLNAVVLDHLTTGTSYFGGGADLPVEMTGWGSVHKIRGEATVEGVETWLCAGDAAENAYREVMSLRSRAAAEDAKGDWPFNPRDRQQAEEEALAPLREVVAQYGRSTDELYDEVKQAARVVAAKRERLRDSHARIAALPQLFIAV